MKLLIAIVNKRDIRHLTDALVDDGIRFTEIGSTGGFLRAGNVTLLIGLEDQHVERTLSIIQSHCHAREEAVNVAHVGTQLDALGIGEAVTTTVGGAQVFIVPVERLVVV